MKKEQIIAILEKYGIDTYHWKLEIASEIKKLTELSIEESKEVKDEPPGHDDMIKAESLFFEAMGINDYPAHKVILNSMDIVQMIAEGIKISRH